MARQTKVETILNLTPEALMAMSRRDLAKNVSILASAANKRLKRLDISGVYSPASEYVRTHGGNFSVAGKNQNQLLIEFFRVQQFLESKTSSVSGAKRWQKKVQKEVSKAIKARTQLAGAGGKAIEKAVNDIFNDPEKRKVFWDLYSRITAEYDVADKYKIIWDDITNAMTANPNATTDDLFEFITKSYEEKYQTKAPQDMGAELSIGTPKTYREELKKATTEIITGRVL